MGIYSKQLQQKEENSVNSEAYADEALLKDGHFMRVETETDDAQNALLYLLDQFNIKVPRTYGKKDVPSILEAVLDPLGMMYDYAESPAKAGKTGTAYILAFRQDGRAVAVTPTPLGYRWFCPNESRSGYAGRSFLKSLAPGCYVLNRPIEKKKTIIRTFIYNVLKYLTIYDMIRLFIATGIITCLGILIPRISSWVFHTYIPDPEAGSSRFLLIAWAFLLVAVMRSGFALVKQLVLARIRIRVSLHFQSAVMARVLHLPKSFFRENSTGKFSKRISSSGRLAGMILDILLDVLLQFLFVGFYLAQMNQVASALYLPALIFLAARLAFSVLAALLSAGNEEKKLNNEMENRQLLYPSIRGIQKIKGTGTENSLYARWAEIYSRMLSYQYKTPFFLKYQNEILSALSVAATVTLLIVTAGSGLTRADYMVFTSSYALVLQTVQMVTDMMKNIFTMRVLAENARPVIEAEPEQTESLEYVQSITGKIRAENIRFRYAGSQAECLKGISLDIRRGEKVAIVGESGCGKSTFLQILLGMEKPDEGMVYYDEKAINTLNLKSLRRQIGSVFQFSRVFPGTVAENVSFASPTPVTDAQIWEALDLAAIGDEIREMPLQLGTEITQSNSSGFSGGQRQRILLARAFLNHPGVLLLDEATSALDNITQKKVLESILASRATVLMVAHRLSTVIDFDRIIMMDGGEIAEEGTYAELLGKNGKFAELIRKQLVEEAGE